MAETLLEKRQDADEFIKEILKRMPEDRKREAILILDGFSLGVRRAGDVGGDKNAQPA